MLMLLAIDPGPVESGWCVLHADDCEPYEADITPNGQLLTRIYAGMGTFVDAAAIEMITSYGMPVGREVFDTVLWIGRFYEALRTSRSNIDTIELVTRKTVKQHLCHDSRAGDVNIRQALIDRFAPGVPNHGKGTKAQPGRFHRFRGDMWAAYALGVTVADAAVREIPDQPA